MQNDLLSASNLHMNEGCFHTSTETSYTIHRFPMNCKPASESRTSRNSCGEKIDGPEADSCMWMKLTTFSPERHLWLHRMYQLTSYEYCPSSPSKSEKIPIMLTIARLDHSDFGGPILGRGYYQPPVPSGKHQKNLDCSPGSMLICGP